MSFSLDDSSFGILISTTCRRQEVIHNHCDSQCRNFNPPQLPLVVGMGEQRPLARALQPGDLVGNPVPGFDRHLLDPLSLGLFALDRNFIEPVPVILIPHQLLVVFQCYQPI